VSLDVFLKVSDVSLDVFLKVSDVSLNVFPKISNVSLRVFLMVSGVSLDVFPRASDASLSRMFRKNVERTLWWHFSQKCVWPKQKKVAMLRGRGIGGEGSAVGESLIARNRYEAHNLT